MKAAMPLVLLFAACAKHTPELADDAKPTATAQLPAVPAARPFAYDEKTDLLDFHYAWSTEGAAVPQLVQRFRAEMEKNKAELLANAKEDKAESEKQGFPFHGYMSSTDYRTAGQSGRLLSLYAEIGSYTGGAHGNSATRGLLWDRQRVSEIPVTDMFAAVANMDRLLTQPWCDALNKAREEKRGEPVGGGGVFDECPKLSEISIVPTDQNGNGKFERLLLIADPYVAGPYAEGSYEVELLVTGDLIAALRSGYRENFEVQPQ